MNFNLNLHITSTRTIPIRFRTNTTQRRLARHRFSKLHMNFGDRIHRLCPFLFSVTMNRIQTFRHHRRRQDKSTRRTNCLHNIRLLHLRGLRILKARHRLNMFRITNRRLRIVSITLRAFLSLLNRFIIRQLHNTSSTHKVHTLKGVP